MRTIPALLLTAAAALSLPAQGHEMIPGYWCTDIETTPKIIDMFNFDGKQLDDLVRKCGTVDRGDHWHAAVGAIQYYCEKLSPETATEKTLVVPFITGPKTFNDLEHHSAYSIDQGLVGSCVVCVPKGK